MAARLTHFKNTSGNTTAEPTFKYTPPAIFLTSAASNRKSRCVAAPSARGRRSGGVVGVMYVTSIGKKIAAADEVAPEA